MSFPHPDFRSPRPLYLVPAARPCLLSRFPALTCTLVADDPRCGGPPLPQAHVHDHARSPKAGRDHGDVLHARLLPHAAKDPRGIPHAHQGPVNGPRTDRALRLPGLRFLFICRCRFCIFPSPARRRFNSHCTPTVQHCIFVSCSTRTHPISALSSHPLLLPALTTPSTLSQRTFTPTHVHAHPRSNIDIVLIQFNL